LCVAAGSAANRQRWLDLASIKRNLCSIPVIALSRANTSEEDEFTLGEGLSVASNYCSRQVKKFDISSAVALNLSAL